MPKNSKKKTATPFSVRFTEEERAQLERLAGATPLGSYIRNSILEGLEADSRVPIRTKRKTPLKDQRLMANVMAVLGQSNVGENLQELARAAHSGSLPLTPETEAAIKQAYMDIRAMRDQLFMALGMHDGEAE